MYQREYLTFFLSCLLAAVLFFTGCVKEPGIGGRAEIYGRVMEQHQDNEGLHPVPDHEVFIVFGSGTIPDDDVRTGPDGRFRFPWLRKGTYTIYTYSECEVNETDCPDGTMPVARNVELGDRKAVIDIGDLQIVNY